ncbi:hypothetical protein [Streptosporangium amethystogenes]|uniref:hypothetical protein n=1 Tax=Streptosporangium amethystogenes TaxID=2002 RepID=UPI0004BD6970|nr:hypothetical protein [Streptosporangium amethystogenes]KUJ65418.1 hypothetical protein ACZ90_47950 [Streptomyces albus subsp. albus]
MNRPTTPAYRTARERLYTAATGYGRMPETDATRLLDTLLAETRAAALAEAAAADTVEDER